MVAVPKDVHETKEGETPMFSVEAVEWAMGRVMESLHGS